MSAIVPDDVEDKPIAGPEHGIPIIFGGGVLSNQYLTDNILASQIITRVVRLALRYGVTAFDTSAYYGPSEIVLGNALQVVRDEFPRSSYKIMTKCGRVANTTFDYEPSSIRKSVMRSLERLQTSYLDTIYLHDIEFVATPVIPRTTGDHTTALGSEAHLYGLSEGDAAKIRGEGDLKILAAFGELQKLKVEGIVRSIGITGYPVPTLLRLAILIRNTSPFHPIDTLLTYSHCSLQNITFFEFMPHFKSRAGVGRIVAASPFSMGLLTSNPPPPWHPSPEALRQAVMEVALASAVPLPEIALDYSLRQCKSGHIPLVIGLTTLDEVHACIKSYRNMQSCNTLEEDQSKAIEMFKKAGYFNWSWSSP